MKTLRDYIDLVNERFNQALSEKVTLPADGSAPVTQTVTTPSGATFTGNAPANAIRTGSGGVLTTGNGAAVTSGTPAPAPDAVAAAKAKLTPSQLKWLGGADATDSAIMARMPKPQPGEAVPGAAPAQAAQAAPATMSAADQEDADMGAAMKANQAAAIGANQDAEDLAMGQAMTANAAQAAALASGAQDDATGVDADVAANAAAPAVAQSAQAAPAAPAAGGKVPPQPTLSGKPSTGPKGQAWLQKYGATHNPDGTPKAAGAPKAPAPAAPANPNGAGRDPNGAYRGDRTNPAAPVGAGAGRGGQGGPTAAQNAERNFNAAKDSQAANVAKEGRTARNDHAFIDELNAMRSIAGLPTKNKW